MRIFTNDVAIRRIAFKMKSITRMFTEMVEKLGDVLTRIERAVRDFHRPIQYGPNVIEFRRRDRMVRIAARP